MKISDLIQKLTVIQATHGSLDVLIEDGDGDGAFEVGSAFVSDDESGAKIAVLSPDDDGGDGESGDGEVIEGNFRRLG